MGHLIALLQTSVSRCISPSEAALITIGRVEAGTQRNILAGSAKLEGIIRTFSGEVFSQLETLIQNDLHGIEAAFGVQTEFVKHLCIPCVNNDSLEFGRVKHLLEDRFLDTKPKRTAEDFAFYALNVPGVFAFCGCMDENHRSPLHADTFDFDEEALVPGLALFIRLAADSI